MNFLTGDYLYSLPTFEKAQKYLDDLKKGAEPGKHLQEVLKRAKVKVHSITAEELIVFLMNTRKPQIFAESATLLDGTDWNQQETAILGDISFSTIGTHAFNNGAYQDHTNHATPLDTHFLFIAGALLRNDHGKRTADMHEVLDEETLNEENLYKLYERRLLPGLLRQNEDAQRSGTSLVINIPGIGCGCFAGQYATSIRGTLPRVLKRFFETHGEKLNRVHKVIYDPYEPLGSNQFQGSINRQDGTFIQLINKPSQLETSIKGSQLEFPQDTDDYTSSRLLKIVAWDHFSFPGNDIWANTVKEGNGRSTDDGVSFASSDVILAMANIGQFSTESSSITTEYDQEKGIVYPKKDGQRFGYKAFSESYPSEVTSAMIDIVPLEKVELNEDERKDITDYFNKRKTGIQDEFIDKMAKMGENQIPLYVDLLEKQVIFFNELNFETSRQDLKIIIDKFRQSCKERIEIADKKSGHGWLYRIIEILCKALLGLLSGIAMVLAALVGQGFANSNHRQRFGKIFFVLDQTEESKDLAVFKQEILTPNSLNQLLESVPPNQRKPLTPGGR